MAATTITDWFIPEDIRQSPELAIPARTTVGVGLLAGLLVADVVGTGGVGTVFFAGAGALFGKWATTPGK